MAVTPYKSYEQQMAETSLVADEKQQEADRSLFENQDMVKIIKTYLEESVPEEIKETDLYQKFWIVFGKKLQLSFIDYEDKFEFEAMFEQAKLAYMMSMPSHEFTFDDVLAIKQLELYFAAALRSAIGMKENRFSERRV